MKQTSEGKIIYFYEDKTFMGAEGVPVDDMTDAVTFPIYHPDKAIIESMELDEEYRIQALVWNVRITYETI